MKTEVAFGDDCYTRVRNHARYQRARPPPHFLLEVERMPAPVVSTERAAMHVPSIDILRASAVTVYNASGDEMNLVDDDIDACGQNCLADIYFDAINQPICSQLDDPTESGVIKETPLKRNAIVTTMA